MEKGGKKEGEELGEGKEREKGERGERKGGREREGRVASISTLTLAR